MDKHFEVEDRYRGMIELSKMALRAEKLRQKTLRIEMKTQQLKMERYEIELETARIAREARKKYNQIDPEKSKNYTAKERVGKIKRPNEEECSANKVVRRAKVGENSGMNKQLHGKDISTLNEKKDYQCFETKRVDIQCREIKKEDIHLPEVKTEDIQCHEMKIDCIQSQQIKKEDIQSHEVKIEDIQCHEIEGHSMSKVKNESKIKEDPLFDVIKYDEVDKKSVWIKTEC